MIYKIIFLILFAVTARALENGSDDLLKTAHQRIGKEFMMVDTFWTNTMIPVAVCLAVVLLIVSIFAVSLIAIRALNEPEPAFVTFAPPGFDALWERNIQAELGMNDTVKKVPLETIMEEENEDLIEVKTSVSKFPDLPVKDSKNIFKLNVPSEPPKPQIATNSKSGLEINE